MLMSWKTQDARQSILLQSTSLIRPSMNVEMSRDQRVAVPCILHALCDNIASVSLHTLVGFMARSHDTVMRLGITGGGVQVSTSMEPPQAYLTA